jgi:predicted metal-dependent hydrolase
VRQSLFATPAHRRANDLWVFVASDDETQIEHAVAHWYQHEAMQLFTQRVAHYAPLLNATPRAVKLSEAKTQWGSCTARGTVRLNLQLIKLPLRLIDYVVVHELSHLREMNHSAAFWRVVASACPDYAKLRRELKAVAL